MKPEIFDNLLQPDAFNSLSNVMMSAEFPWYFVPGKSMTDVMRGDKNIFQFIHPFYMNYGWTSQHANILDPILQLLRPYAIIRIKANLTTVTKEKIQYDYHRDTDDDLIRSKTALFYVNSNDGLTVFSSGEKVESVANRLVIFNSSCLHAGTSSTDQSRRIVINFNYFDNSL